MATDACVGMTVMSTVVGRASRIEHVLFGKAVEWFKVTGYAVDTQRPVQVGELVRATQITSFTGWVWRGYLYRYALARYTCFYGAYFVRSHYAVRTGMISCASKVKTSNVLNKYELFHFIHPTQTKTTRPTPIQPNPIPTINYTLSIL